MGAEKRKAPASRQSLPNAAPTNKRIPAPPTTPAATNKRSARHTTDAPSTSTRQPKTSKLHHTPRPTARNEEKEAGEAQTTDDAFTSLCAAIDSLAALQPHSPSSDRATFTTQHQPILSSLHRLSPPASLSSLTPPSPAALIAIQSAADQLIAIARKLQSITPSNPLLQPLLQQLHSIQLPLSSSDAYSLLLFSSITLCQLLSRSTGSHSSHAKVSSTTHIHACSLPLLHSSVLPP